MSTATLEVPASVKQIFAQVLRMNAEQVEMGSSTRSTRNWDSLRHVELVVAIEERFKVAFSATEVFALTSVQGFCDILQRKGVALASTD